MNYLKVYLLRKLGVKSAIRWLSLMFITLMASSFLHAQTESPNCVNLSPSINSNDSVYIQVGELVSNTNSFPVSIVIRNEFSGIIDIGSSSFSSPTDLIQFEACDVAGQTLEATISNSRGTCWSQIALKHSNAVGLICNLDTAIWCFDDLLAVDANDYSNLAWYNIDEAPYTVLPTLFRTCGTDVTYDAANAAPPSSIAQVRDWYVTQFERYEYYTTDWIETFDCDSDTSKIITRETSAVGKDGKRVSCTDTIVVYKLNITDVDATLNPAKDSIFCEYDTMVNPDTEIDYTVWKQLVGLHSEGSYLYYPTDFVDAALAVADADPTGTIEAALRGISIVERGSTSYSIYEIDALDSTLFNGKHAHRFGPIEIGDRVLSNDGEYITVTSDWLFTPGAHGFWVDLALPHVDNNSTMVICDTWPDSDCDGLRVRLPVDPSDPTGDSTTFCMNTDLVNSNKCSVIIISEEKDLGGSCPRVVKVNYEIKNLCSNTTFEYEQWKMYIDTIAPFIETSDNTFTYYADNHDCNAQVRVPSIEAKDLCSGVKAVKAMIQGQRILLERNDDGSWSHPEQAPYIRLAINAGDSPYTVLYEAIDSCHNISTATSYNIYVRDITPPSVLVDDELNLATSDDQTWMSMDGIIQQVNDNCGICMQLVRRADWAESCNIDLCDSIVRTFTTEAQMDAYIAANGINAIFSGSEVEEYYAETYQWLVEDGQCCARSDEDVLIQSWQNGIKQYWAQNCLADGVNIEIDNVQYGAGWGKKIPICCSDACGDGVEVEILVIDAHCNYTRASTTINVQMQLDIARAFDFDTVSLSCHAYNTLGYASAVTNAMSGNHTALNNLLGDLLVGENVSNGNLVADNQIIDRTQTYATDSIIDASTTDDTTFDWQEYNLTTQLGAITSSCSSMDPAQDVRVSLNSCGVGTITRIWKDIGNCSATFTDSIVQIINIGYANSLYGATADTARLSPGFSGIFNDVDSLHSDLITLDDDGNIPINTNNRVTVYTAEDACRQYTVVAYSDELVDSTIGADESTFYFDRTYTIMDTCSGDTTTRSTVVGPFIVPLLRSGARSSNLRGQIAAVDENLSTQNIEVNAFMDNGTSSTYLTDATGEYGFDMSEGESFNIEPQKNSGLAEGVNIKDINRIREHIEGTNPITDTYELIAADVNNDGIINTKDIVTLQSVTLGKSNAFPNNSSWRFYSQLTGEESYRIESLVSGMQVDFVGVKIGNVEYDPITVARSAGEASFVTSDAQLESGVQKSVVLTRENEDLNVYQFTLAYDPTAIRINDLKGIGLSDANWHRIADGQIRIISMADVTSDLIIDMDVLRDAQLSDVLNIVDASNFNAISLMSNDQIVPTSLVYGDAEGFELYQNVPNPTSGSTSIGFMMADDAPAKISFYDISGKLLKVIDGDYQKGLNEIKINTAELGVSGVVHYRLETTHFTKTRRMVIL